MNHNFKIISICLFIIACQNNKSQPSNLDKPNSTTIHELLSDTFQDAQQSIPVNSDSIQTLLLKRLKIKSTQSIATFDPIQLQNTYQQLLFILRKSNDSTRSEQNQWLYSIFEKLNETQAQLEEKEPFEIKMKLQIAQFKSEIRPYFKK